MLVELTAVQLTYLMAIVTTVALIVFGIGIWAGYWMGRNSAGLPVTAPGNRKPTAADAPYHEELFDDPFEQAIHGVDEEEKEALQ